MRIQFKISQTANFWHFVSNLVGWHDSVRLYYRDYWLEQTGPLTKAEDECLKELEDFFRKYTYGENYWGKVLLLVGENVWEKVGQKFTADETALLKKVFNVFSSRFKKIWDIDRDLLELWKTRLEKTSSRFAKKDIVRDLNAFFNSGPSLEKATVLLLLCDKRINPAGGGANLGKGYLTLEVSRADVDAVRPAWLIFWHEITHHLWQENSLDYQQLRRDLSEKMKNEGLEGKILQIPIPRILNEVVVDSLFPYGYLSEKHLDFPVEAIFSRFDDKREGKKFKVEDWRYYFPYWLKDLAKEYIETKKKIDSQFFDEIKRLYIQLLRST